jgi:hypothetical protein
MIQDYCRNAFEWGSTLSRFCPRDVLTGFARGSGFSKPTINTISKLPKNLEEAEGCIVD